MLLFYTIFKSWKKKFKFSFSGNKFNKCGSKEVHCLLASYIK